MLSPMISTTDGGISDKFAPSDNSWDSFSLYFPVLFPFRLRKVMLVGSTKSTSLEEAVDCKFQNVAVILDSTEAVTKVVFESMRDSFLSNLLDLLKSKGGIKAVMSVRVYYQNQNCSDQVNLTEAVYFPPTKGQSKVRDALKGLQHHYKENATFNYECAEKLLMTQYEGFEDYNKEGHVGLIIAGFASVQYYFPEKKSWDYGVFVYNREKPVIQKALIENRNSVDDLVTEITGKICFHPTTPSLTSARTTNSVIDTTVPTHGKELTNPHKHSSFTPKYKSTTVKMPTTASVDISTVGKVKSSSTSKHVQGLSTKSTSKETTVETPTKVTEISSRPTTTVGTPEVQPDHQRLKIEIASYMTQSLKPIMGDDTKIKKFMETGCNLMSQCAELQATHEVKEVLASVWKEEMNLTEYVKTSLLDIGSGQGLDKRVVYRGKNIGMRIEKKAIDKFQEVRYVDECNNSLSVPEYYFQEMSHSADTASAAVIALLDYATPHIMKETIIHDNEIADKSFMVAIKPGTDVSFKGPIKYTIHVKTEKHAFSCVYWKKSSSISSGEWSGDGCKTIEVKGKSVTCECHLQDTLSFSVLVKRFSLNYITYIGCGIAAGACIILLLIFIILRHHLQYDQNGVHFNLAFAIAVSNGLFISADFAYTNEYICMGVSIGIMFFYLATFFWILIEAIHLHMKVVRMATHTNMMKYYFFLGWVCPAIIVAIIAALKTDYFRRTNFCWLSYDDFIIWAFVGPILFIIFVSVVILARSLMASFKMETSLPGVFKFQRVAKITLFVILVIGLCWSFSLIAVNEKLIIYQYVLTGLNIFFGLLTFVSFCIISEGVKKSLNPRRKSTHSIKSASSFVTGRDNRGKEASTTSLPLAVVTDKTLHSKTNF